MSEPAPKSSEDIFHEFLYSNMSVEDAIAQQRALRQPSTAVDVSASRQIFLKFLNNEITPEECVRLQRELWGERE